MRHALLAMVCALAASTAEAELSYTANIWADYGWPPYITDLVKTRCRTTWNPVTDPDIYAETSFDCRLYHGPIGPQVPNEIAYEVIGIEDPAPYTTLSFLPWFIDFTEDDTIVSGCGDRKWRITSTYRWEKQPDNCEPEVPGAACSGVGTKTKTVAVVWQGQ